MRLTRLLSFCLCIGAALAVFPASQAEVGHCEPGWQKANGKCFLLVHSDDNAIFTTKDGSSQCESIGAELFQSDGCLPLSGCDSGRGSVCVKPFSNCAVGWYEGKRACYQLNGNPLSWDEAKTSCNQMGGDLIQVTEEETQKFLVGYLPAFRKQGIPYLWIGIYQADRSKPLSWTSGPEVATTFNNWAPGEPRLSMLQRNAGRVLTNSENGTWQVGRPTESGGYICELPIGASPSFPTPDYTFTCPFSWQLFRRNCYYFTSIASSWQGSRDICRRFSAASDLPDIRDANEQEFVQRSLNGRPLWLGLRSKLGKWGDWYWNDDAQLANYFNWNNGEPNNEGGVEFCVEMSPNGRWNDQSCEKIKTFACKRPANINGSPPTRLPTTVTPRWDPACGSGWFRDPISNQCYLINLEPMNWNEARIYCKDKRGDLASITTLSEKTFITSQLQGAIQSGANALAFWIGFNDRAIEGSWEWSDGSPVPFINWDYGQPSNADDKDCAHILPGKNFFWNDELCTRLFPSVCKKSGVSTGTTLKPVPTTIPVPDGQTRGCPSGYTGFNNMCYRFYTESKDWSNARQQCRNDGGDLVSMENRQEHTFVYEMVQKTGNYDGFWIGLRDTAAAIRTMYFQWIDGSPTTFTNWNKGEPNDWQGKENCVKQLAGQNRGQWNDVSCDNQLPFVCKRRQVALVSTLPTTRMFGCPAEYDDVYNGFCYRYVIGRDPITWSYAGSYCRNNGGYLVSILTSEEQGHLNLKMYALNSNQSFWIGLGSNGGGTYFYWTVGPSLGSTSYTNWATGANVKSYYGSMYPSGRAMGTWTMENYNTLLRNYICKRPQDGPPTTQPPPTTYDPKFCAVGWVEADNTCYKVFQISSGIILRGWDEARIACKRLGGDLASIHSVNGTAVLRSVVANVSTVPYWIGLNSRDTDKSHKWIDGTSPNYFNWKPNEPNNFNKRLNCVLLDPSDMQWFVTSCSTAGNYICETPKGINPGNLTTIPPTSRPIEPYCGAGFQYYKGSCYYAMPYAYDWYAARQTCKQYQADLVSIVDDEENQFVNWLVARQSFGKYYWIGLNELGQTEGYRWSDRSPVSYLNWKQNEPNNAGGAEHCVNIHAADGLWSDELCGLALPFVCKRNNETRKTDPPSTPMPGECPREYYAIGDKCFRLFSASSDAATWSEAFDLCRARGEVNRTYLASIHSEYEQAALIALAADAGADMWIGLFTRPSPRKYSWIDNSRLSYSNWDRGEPNGNANNTENCVMMYTQKYRAGKWNDIRCDQKRGYICMTYKQPNILTTWPGPQPTRVLCSPGWTQYRSACFKFYDQPATWSDALKQCQSDKANLASVHDVWEQNYLHSLTRSKPLDDTWIGIFYKQIDDVFVWLDDWPVIYTYWGPYQPRTSSGSCVRMYRDGKWYTSSCSVANPFLCRISYGQPPTTPLTISGRCPSNEFVQYGQYCYLITDVRISFYWRDFASAQLECKLKGGDLASITSPGEQDFLAQYINQKTQVGGGYTNFWIGMTRQPDSGFQWMDGSAVNYVHWAQGEPSDKGGSAAENCVEMYQQNFQWNAAGCSAKNAYVCKVPKRPFSGATGQTSSNTVASSSEVTPTATSTRTTGDRTQSSSSEAATTDSKKSTLAQTGKLIENLRDDLLVGGIIVGIILALLALVFAVFFYRRHYTVPKSADDGFSNANWSKSSESVMLDTGRSQGSGREEVVNPNFSRPQ